ncbi:MAG TPA: helix-turn-helix domain-containing protein [Acidimicrobiia bacterium]|nr:helix-turn-helix domain-containing protein [Acidimicrobiia bacterium]
MARKSLVHLDCSVANVVDEINDAWAVLILRDAFLGVRRFDQFVESLGIARNTLTDRLDRLVRAGILSAEPYQERPLRYDYRLTDRGKDLFDVLMTLWSYGEKWLPPPNPDRQRAIHLDCGEEAAAVAHCGHCGGRLTRRNVRVLPAHPLVAADA